MSHEVAKKAKPSINLNCGSCAGLKRERVMETFCSLAGQLEVSPACSKHTPDAFTLTHEEPERVLSLVQMGRVFRGMSANDLQILAAVLAGERRSRNAGYYFMEKVYIRVQGASGRNYMKNFVMGFVLDANREEVRIISESGKTAIVMPNDKNGSTLYKLEAFEAIRTEAIEAGRWTDPDVVRDRMRRESNAIETLDHADANGLLDTPTAARRKIKKISTRGSDDSLVGIVSKLNRGVMRENDLNATDNSYGGKTITISWG